MSRGRVSVIRDPAVAVAAAKCWLARWHKGKAAAALGISVNSFHPEDCGFCDYPTDGLIGSVSEFVRWANLEPERKIGEPAPMRAEVEMFLTLPKADQQEAVRRAQGYAHGHDEDV